MHEFSPTCGELSRRAFGAGRRAHARQTEDRASNQRNARCCLSTSLGCAAQTCRSPSPGLTRTRIVYPAGRSECSRPADAVPALSDLPDSSARHNPPRFFSSGAELPMRSADAEANYAPNARSSPSLIGACLLQEVEHSERVYGNAECFRPRYISSQTYRAAVPGDSEPAPSGVFNADA